ncbi:MAG: hypothetical protein NTV97_20925 [Alphaproteobacteria bacterium]|nr:hypothetical protein [Alphaproteobacteria bacterium]
MPLSDTELSDLRAFVGTMIPASARYGMPGADDDLIFADIVKNIGRDLDDVRTALGRLAGIAKLDPVRRLETANAFRAEGGPTLVAIARVILLCYYRDDRVMRSLGQEPRPPFPKGHVVEQGDWSLLDPVKARKPFWRSAS